jgi:diguanylate cyclase (GGDEF)-like protein/PAS domain S-box-containing protein
MTIGSRCLAWLRASLHTATVAGLILIAACWLVAAFVSSVEHEKTIEGMVKQSDSMVRLFEDYTVEIVERLDRTLLLLRKSYEDDPGHFDLRSWAARTELVGDETFQIAVIGADGYRVTSTTDYEGPPMYLGDREHFRTHLDLASDKLFISEPVVGRATGKASLQFSRRVRAPGGGFGGVIVISINPNFIARFYRAVDLGEKGSIVLRNLDGVILAAQGLSTGAIGRQTKQQPLLEALARSRSGSYWGGRAIDGYNRLVTYRTSEKFPLIFAVGLAENDGLSGYRTHRTTYFMAAAVVSLIVLIAMAFTIRHQAKLDDSQGRLRLLNEEISEQNVRFDAALANMSTGLSMFDADGRLMVWNDRYAEIYGMAPELIRRGVSIHTIIQHRKEAGNLEHDVDAYIGEFRQQLIDDGKSASSSRLADGRVISVANTAIAGGGWVGIHEDVTERIDHETSVFHQATELALVNMRFDAALSNMTQGVCLFDADRNLVIANRRFSEMYGYPEELVVPGTPLLAMLQHHARQGVKSDLTIEEHVQRMPTELNQYFSTLDGRVISIKRAPTPDGGWVATHEDVTAQKRAEAEIAHMARHDALTGLANRAEFNARLAEASHRIQRHGSAVTVLMIDLDKFKAVNDTLGHPAGDQLLVEVGQRLQSALRETDVLARLGGDEFAIIQEGGGHQCDGAIALAQRIIEVIAQPFDLNGHPAHIGSSIGIAMAPEHGIDPEQLLTAADLALYDVKAGGRNDFRVFKAAMLEVARTRKSAESELREAIERNEFELHYQPVVDVKRHLLCGVEALVRWRHPTRGLVAPEQFIPLAESTGLIVPLGEWILHQACTDAASLPEHIKVAVNVSAMQFRKGNLFNTAARVLAETGLSPHRLELEITETTHLENQEAHLATMRRLKAIGVSMVLDDYGKGYSSINYLTTFPFDKIKIDKSFTEGALDRSDCAAVIASAQALAQGLGIVTTAEGVETAQQFEYMRNAGVDLVQGFLFGRAVPIAEFGPQTAKTVEMLCRVAKPRSDASLRKRDGSKLRA